MQEGAEAALAAHLQFVDAHLDRQARAVAPHGGQFQPLAHRLCGDVGDAVHAGLALRPQQLGRNDQGIDRLAQRFGGAVAEGQLRRPVPDRDPAVPAETDIGVVGVLDHAAQFALALAQLVGAGGDPGLEVGAQGLERGLGFLLRLDLLHHRHVVLDLAAGIALAAHVQIDPDHPAVLAHIALLQLVLRDLAVLQALHQLQVAVQILGQGDVLEGQALQLFLGIADDLAQGPVDADPAAGRRDQRNADAGQVEDRAEARFARLQHGLRALQVAPGHRQALAVLDFVLHQVGHVDQDAQLVGRERAHAVAERAQGADCQSATRADRHAGVEADVRRARHQRVVGKARVAGGVGDDQRLVLQDGVGAEGVFARRFAGLEADPRLEILALGVHEGEQRNRHLQHAADEAGDAVEDFFGFGVEQVERVDQFLAFGFIGRVAGCGHEFLVLGPVSAGPVCT